MVLGIIGIVVGITGIVIGVLFYIKSKAYSRADTEKIVYRLEEIKKTIGLVAETASPKQKQELISSAQSIIHTLSGSIDAKSAIGGRLNTIPNMNIIDSTAGETGDKCPEE